jgi:hypothetical protein
MWTAGVLLVVAALGMPQAQGYYKYVALIPNGGNVPDSPNIGHLSEDGTTGLNDFGDAFATAGDAWTTALCQEDTDGDGYTNGQELGDPCCTWSSTNTAGLVTDGISHPSDATQVPTSAELLAGCTSSTTTTSGSTNGTTGDDVNDVLAPVSAGSSSAMPTDDDEDDSDEMAETDAAPVSASLSALAALVAATAAALAM